MTDYNDEFKLELERMVKKGDFFARDGDEMLDTLIARRDTQRDEALVEGLAKWLCAKDDADVEYIEEYVEDARTAIKAAREKKEVE